MHSDLFLRIELHKVVCMPLPILIQRHIACAAGPAECADGCLAQQWECAMGGRHQNWQGQGLFGGQSIRDRLWFLSGPAQGPSAGERPMSLSHIQSLFYLYCQALVEIEISSTALLIPLHYITFGFFQLFLQL